MPDMSFLVLAGTAAILGAAVQSSVGLGLGLLAAPVVSVIDPTLMPGAVLIATMVLPVFSLASEWRHVDWRGMAWGLPGRVLGSLAGAWVVATLDADTLGAAVGAIVLLAVVLSVRSVRVRITPTTLFSAGAISGTTGTATSIGGPAIALLYQHEPGARVRATLAGFFLFGAGISLAALALTGELDRHEVVGGLALLPFVVAGFLAGRPVRRIVDPGRLRAGLLAVVALSGVTLIVRALA